MAQGTVYKSVIKNAAYIFFIKLFPAFASIAVLILYSRELPQADYGNYQELWVKLLLFGTLAYAGLPVTVITYSADYIKSFIRSIKPKHVLLYALWSQVCIVAFSYFLAALQLPSWLLIALPMLYAVHAVQEALLMASRQMRGLLVINFLYAAYFLAVHVYFLKSYNLASLLSWLAAGMVARSLLLMVMVYSVYRPIKAELPEEERLLSARRLWLHLGFYDLIQTLFRYVDKFILAQLLSAGLFAVYFNGAQSAEVPLLPYLLGAVANSVLIQLSAQQQEPSNSYNLLRVSGKLLSCIVFPLFFFLLFFAQEIFTVVFTEKYLESVPVFLTAIMVLPLRAYNYTTMLQHLHQGAIINKGAVLDLVLALALMYPLFRLMGLPGVALSFVLSTYVQVAYYLWHTSRLVKIPVTKLLPLGDWFLKFISFGGVLAGVYFLSLQFTKGSGVLLAGFVSVILLSAISCFFQLRSVAANKHSIS